ncbi:SGNH/GDSL hydrolase family protein [Acinetobacter sp. C32I]|uniref:SGNH/GDSL hydrolase family protein n=1 Tax=Acinetobacter sp. C32I TaxID=2950074 RepID=UPI0020366DBE|nr:SGNH/GDSL hydrolase family protein [Acinetobacter sp. C32I]USA52757.1 SGNH/GDSL hydrolase family protein [Acinetobacter sp. C32I]
MKRNIRLKEQQALSTVIHTPRNTYWEIRPTLDKKLQFRCNTDQDGFITTGNYVSSSKRIFIMGDSFVESMYSTEYLRISSCLERELFNHGLDFQVFNTGVSGTTSLNILNSLLNKVVLYKPSLIVVFIPTNDVYANNYKDGMWNKTKLFGNIAPPLIDSDFDNILTAEKIEDTVKIYEIMNNVCKVFNIKLLVSASPFIDVIDDNFYKISKAAHQDACVKRKTLYKSIFEFCKQNNVSYFETKDIVDRKFFYDDVHLNDCGGRVFSDLIFNNIVKFLPKETKSLSEEFIIDDINVLTDDTIWMAIGSTQYEIAHIVLYYQTDCNEDAIKNNALFCLKFNTDDSTHDLEGLRYSNSVGYFNYLNTDKNLKVGCSLKFKTPQYTKSFKIGFRSWHKTETVKLKNIKVVVFYK